MASGRIGSASGLNVFIDWTSNENSITANLYLYNQYRISTTVSKSWSLSINGDIKQGTVALGEKAAGSITLIGSHTVNGLSSNSNYAISGSLAINLNSYNGSAVSTLNANGTGNTDKSIPQYATITSFNVSNLSGVDGLTKVKFSWAVDSTTDYAWYSIDGGKSWNNLPTTNIVSGLQPNTSYNFKLRVRRKDSQLTTDSNTVTRSTYDIARISNIEDFEHGDNINLQVTNPASISELSLSMKIENTLILTKSAKTGSNEIIMTDEELDNLYKQYGSGNNLTATFVLSGSGYTNTKNCIITLTGNQKTIYIGTKRGKVFMGTKRAVTWQNVNGTWKRGG